MNITANICTHPLCQSCAKSFYTGFYSLPTQHPYSFSGKPCMFFQGSLPFGGSLSSFISFAGDWFRFGHVTKLWTMKLEGNSIRGPLGKYSLDPNLLLDSSVSECKDQNNYSHLPPTRIQNHHRLGEQREEKDLGLPSHCQPKQPCPHLHRTSCYAP